MGSRPTKKEIEEKHDGWRKRIVLANDKLAGEWEGVKAKWSVTLVYDCRDPHALAKLLSTKFTSLRFIVAYAHGHPSISAEPVKAEWKTEYNYDHEWESNVRQVEEYASGASRTGRRSKR